VYIFARSERSERGSEFPNLRGVMDCNSCSKECILPWNVLIQKLALISLVPHDVGGGGACFFRAFSQQFFGNPELHHHIRLSGVNHLSNHPELYVESFGGDSWQGYITEMSKSGTWCDNLIIQAVSNTFNCVIHITDST
ncbi:predicted protein, partial [Nematostella vectensis]